MTLNVFYFDPRGVCGKQLGKNELLRVDEGSVDIFQQKDFHPAFSNHLPAEST
jgi:hypothetical protein